MLLLVVTSSDAFSRRMFNYGYCQQLHTLRELCVKYDKTLSHILINRQSCIYQLLPPVSIVHMQLRTRTHSFALPQCKTLWYKIVLSIVICFACY